MSFKSAICAVLLASSLAVAPSHGFGFSKDDGTRTGSTGQPTWDTTQDAFSLETARGDISEKLKKLKFGTEIYRISVKNSSTGEVMTYSVELAEDTMTISEELSPSKIPAKAALAPALAAKFVQTRSDVRAFRRLMARRGFWHQGVDRCPDFEQRAGFSSKMPSVSFVSGVANRRYDEITFEGATQSRYCRIKAGAAAPDQADMLLDLLKDWSGHLNRHGLGRELKAYIKEHTGEF